MTIDHPTDNEPADEYDESADQRVFVLDDEKFAEFVLLLDRAPQTCPLLTELLTRPTRFDRKD